MHYSSKIAAIKAIREMRPTWLLQEAKALADRAQHDGTAWEGDLRVRAHSESDWSVRSFAVSSMRIWDVIVNGVTTAVQARTKVDAVCLYAAMHGIRRPDCVTVRKCRRPAFHADIIQDLDEE